jgi:hypothetical protein
MEFVIINNKDYQCYDKDDIPFSCNGYGSSNNIQTISAPCPDNWLLNAKKHNMEGWLHDPTAPIIINKQVKSPQGSYYVFIDK